MRLGQSAGGVLPVVERPGRDHTIECAVCERQGIGARDLHLGVEISPACLYIPPSLRNHGGRNVNADQLRIRKHLAHGQENLSWTGADVKYTGRSSLLGDILGHQFVVPKESRGAAQRVVKDTPRPGDPFRMKPLNELPPTAVHIA